MTSDRMRRVNEAIRQVIGDAVASDLKDPRVGFVTVTDVRTSADLSHARVYVSVLGEPETRAETMDGLRSAHEFEETPTQFRLDLVCNAAKQFVAKPGQYCLRKFRVTFQ